MLGIGSHRSHLFVTGWSLYRRGHNYCRFASFARPPSFHGGTVSGAGGGSSDIDVVNGSIGEVDNFGNELPPHHRSKAERARFCDACERRPGSASHLCEGKRTLAHISNDELFGHGGGWSATRLWPQSSRWRRRCLGARAYEEGLAR